MKRYETFIIVDPDVSDDDRNQLLDRLKEVIAEQNGTLVVVDEWGSRKLAYEIRKKPRGYYVRFDYCGTGALVNEMERLFRIDDRVMKYMTVVLAEEVDMAEIEAEIAKAAPEAAEETPETAEEPEDTEPAESETTPKAQPAAEDAEAEPAAEEAETEPASEEAAEEAAETETEASEPTEPETKTKESE